MCVRIYLKGCIAQLEWLLPCEQVIRVAAKFIGAKVLDCPGLRYGAKPDGVGNPVRVAGQDPAVLDNADDAVVLAAPAFPDPAAVFIDLNLCLDPAAVAHPSAKSLPRGLNEIALRATALAMKCQGLLSFWLIPEVFSRLTSLIWLPVASPESGFGVSHVSRFRGVE
jgi:hypothetical protein